MTRNPVLERAGRLVRDRQGVLTRELLRAPGGFGLGQVPQRLQPDAATAMVCGYCSVGCSLDVHLKDGQAINLSPTTDYPVNLGMACPKGWEALTPLRAPDRATSPLLRDAGGRLRAVDWPAALATFVSRMKGIQARHGKASVAFLSTGQIAMEEMALLGTLGKFGMGLLHGDGNTRQCMATSVVAYKQAFGFDAPPYTYQRPGRIGRHRLHRRQPVHRASDPVGAGCAGIRTSRRSSSSTRGAPKRRRRRPGTCRCGRNPISCLLYAVAHVLVRQGWIDRPLHRRPHQRDFEAFSEHLEGFPPDAVAERCGLERRRHRTPWRRTIRRRPGGCRSGGRWA